MIHIGGQHKVILVLYQCQQHLVNRKRCIYIAVIENMTAPPGPVFLQCVKRIKSAGVDICDPIFLMEV